MGILGTAAPGRAKERKRKPDELLASVVRETAVAGAVELLRTNTPFVLPSGEAWVMLVLAAGKIGGLSKQHSRRDEAKGSLVELIDSDQIRTVATREMLDEEVFGIIPTADTLDRMKEYSLLSGAEYTWAVVWQKPTGELVIEQVADATYAQARAVATGTETLESAIGATAWNEHSGVVVGAGTPAEETQAISSDVAGDDDPGDEVFDEIPFEEGSEGDDADTAETIIDWSGSEADEESGAAHPSGWEEFGYGEDEPGTGNAVDAPVEVDADSYGETAGFAEVDDENGSWDAEDERLDWEQEPSVESPAAQAFADQQAVRDHIARRFLSEDLELEIDLTEFDATFAIGAPVVQIAVPDGATEWLGDQIAQLNRQANADMTRMRWAHEDELRTLYVKLMSTHVEQVMRKVATDREGSKYKALKDATEADHQARLAEKDQKARDLRTEIVQKFEAQAKQIGEQAALQAELQYKERNRARMEREQADAVADIDRTIEDDRSRASQEILRVRRADASLQMQHGTTAIFEVLSEKQSDFLKAEDERLTQWKEEIQRIVDDYRKADIAQAETLAEHQRTTDEIGDLRREQEALLESLRSAHADRIRRLEEELERSRSDAIVQLKAREEEWQHSLSLEQEKTKSQTNRASDLLSQISSTEEAVKRRYEGQIAELKEDRESWAREMERASQVQGRSSKLVIVLLVALTLLGTASGFIGGVGFAG